MAVERPVGEGFNTGESEAGVVRIAFAARGGLVEIVGKRVSADAQGAVGRGVQLGEHVE